jgi:sugar transferase (PEP-CTERM system associated)
MSRRLFDRYLQRRTLVHAVFDLSLVVLSVLAVVIALGDQPYRVVPVAATHGFSLAACMVVINTASGFYRQRHDRTFAQSCLRAAVALLLALVLAYGIFSLIPTGTGEREALKFAAMVGVAAVTVNRGYAAHIGASRNARHRILIYGAGPAARLVGEALDKASPRAEIVGYLAGPNEAESSVTMARLLPANASLVETVQVLGVDEIVVALTERRKGSMPMRALLDCKLSGVRISDAQTHFEKSCRQINLNYVSAGSLIFGSGFNQSSYRTAVKRAFDVAGTLLLLVLTAPVMLVTALLIALESRGPIVYRQERVGLHGRVFKVLKFRSMRSDAEKDGTPRFAAARDDRVTRVGRVIRTFRIDEIPQLVNVLRGEMSLVGPRPERPFFVGQLTEALPYYAARHSLKPGITGWAQVCYQYGATLEDSREKLQYDLYYVKNHSLRLDLLILLKTVAVVLSGKGSR